MKELESNSLIVVSNLVENEDGSATMQIDTTREATEFLVQEGLVSLLEKAIDAENKDYALSPELRAELPEREEKDPDSTVGDRQPEWSNRMSENDHSRKSE